MRDYSSGESTIPVSAKIGAGFIVFLLAVGGLWFFGSSTRVSAQEACVLLSHGRYQEVRGPGRYFDPSWGTSYECLTVRPVQAEYVMGDSQWDVSNADRVAWSVHTDSADGMVVDLTATLSYSIQQENVETVWKKNGRSDVMVWEKIVDIQVASAVRDVANGLPIRTLYLEGRADTDKEMRRIATERLASYGVTLETFDLKEVIPPPEYRDKIAKQQDEVEAAQQKKAEVETARQEAARLQVEAQGRADADLIIAEGQAEQNAIIGQSIQDHPEILTLEYYEALSGVAWAILSPDDVQPTMPIAIPAATPAP